MAYWRWRSGLTGGGADDLDGIDGDDLTAGDVTLVLDATNKFLRYYVVEDPIGESESSPEVIIPDNNAGTKGHRLYRVFASGLFADSNDMPTLDPDVQGDKSVIINDGGYSDGDYTGIIGGKDVYITNSSATSDYSGSCGGSTISIDDSPHAFSGGGLGNEINSADGGAVLGGRYANSHLYGMLARASGKFSASGDAQESRFVARNTTTDATATDLFLDGSSERIVLPASRSWRFSIDIMARQTAGTAGTVGDSAFWTITGGIKRDGAGNTALIGTPQGTGVPGANDRDAAAAAWSVAVTADDTNDALDIAVTGEANKTIHWVAKIELVEVG